MADIYPLCVENQTVETICNVSFSNSLILPVDKLVVKSYSKDEKILQSKPSMYLSPCDEIGKKKLPGFVKYLRERKKAGVVSIGNTSFLYLIPSGDSGNIELGCAQIDAVTKKAQQSVSNQPSSSMSLMGNGPQRAVDQGSSSILNAKGTATTGVSFMADLLQKAESAQPRRVDASSSSHTSGAGNKNVVDPYAQFEDYLRTKVRTFFTRLPGLPGDEGDRDDVIPSAESSPHDIPDQALFLEPMDKAQRYIVHDLVSREFEGTLLTASHGEREGRHVVVYRDGFSPPGVKLENYVDPVKIQVVRATAPTTSRRKAQLQGQKSLMAVGTEGLSQVGLVKRDRRTQEEIQMDLKKRKLNKALEDAPVDERDA